MSTRKRTDEDFAREIEAHLALETDRLVEEGLDPQDARTAACRRFGNVTTARERFHDRTPTAWLDRLVQDVRAAGRSVRRYPVAAAVAVLSLAATIGAATVTLTVRDAVFHKPPPLYADPGQLSRVQVGRPEAPIMPYGSAVPASVYTAWRDALGPSIAASRSLPGVRDVGAGDRVDTTGVRLVSPHMFDLLGVPPDLGRTFTAEAAGGGPHEAVVSHGVWQRLLDARDDAIGTVVWIDGRPYTVIGVMPARFWLGDLSSPIWLPLDPQALSPDDGLEVMARRAAGVTHEMLAARLQAGLEDYARRLPTADRRLQLRVSGLDGSPLGHQVAPVLPYILATAVLLTLVTACANVAVLMIARWTAREREIAIRAAIGASRGRILRTLLTESVMLAACGGALGVCATLALMGWVRRRGGDAAYFDLSIDPRIFAQVAALTLLTGVLAGIAPALYETRRLYANPLRNISGSDRVRQRWRHALVVFEITVTVALLVVTVSMVHGYQRARRAQMGYAPASLMTARVENPSGIATSQILEGLRQLPGVADAAASATMPPPFLDASEALVATDSAGSHAVRAHRHVVSARFFSTLRVPIRAGRPFSDADLHTARPAIANETLAHRLFPGRPSIGERIRTGDTTYEIVGIAADYSSSPLQYPATDPALFLLLPPDSPDVRRMHLVIRAEGDPAVLVSGLRRELHDTAPGTVASVYTVDQILRVMGQEILAGTAPLIPLVAIGMLLTSAGIYGILAFAVERRSRELAVRMALGASRADLVRLIGRQTAWLVTAGASLGVGATFGLAQVVRAGGGSASIFDPRLHAFVIPVLIVLAIGLAATWTPSRRARRIDAAALLRDE